jgi:redox-sensitive bicupin YhaK (pirin superfamily)
MTSGRGIAHSEETPRQNSGILDGVQLWVALPDHQRHILPLFDHYASPPIFNIASATVILIAGKLLEHQSPARAFSPIVGADIAFADAETINLPLDTRFEHAIFVLHGTATLDGRPMEPDALHYLSPGRDELHIGGSRHCRMLLIGGEPFPEPILMWWNFVARTHSEIEEARRDWERQERFGEVRGYSGARVPSPPK